MQVKLLARVSRFFREPGAAGSARGLEHCERTADGFVCRWARARMSPARIVQLGRDLQYIVDGGAPTVHVHWGKELLREYSLDEFAELPLESLRKANLIGVSSFGAGRDASVSLNANVEPALEAIVRGPDDVAQQVKDAVELGDWNPVSSRKIRLVLPFVVAYALGAMLFVIPGDIKHDTATILSVLIIGAIVATHWLAYRLWPLVEIAVEKTTLGSILRSAVPILAGVASFVVTVLKIFGVGD